MPRVCWPTARGTATGAGAAAAAPAWRSALAANPMPRAAIVHRATDSANGAGNGDALSECTCSSEETGPLHSPTVLQRPLPMPLRIKLGC
jgi:hypothetical protein